MRNILKTCRTILFPTCWILLILQGCGNEDLSSVKKKVRVIPGVKTVTVQVKKVGIPFTTAGSVRSVVRSVLTSKVVGNVKEVRVREGDRVEKGEVLLTIESRDIRAKIRQAEGALQSANAVLKNTESNYRRLSALYSRGSATRFEFDGAVLQLENAKGMVKQAEGGLREARTMEQYSRILAPMDGVVSRKMIDVGEQAAPGRPLLTIEKTSRLQFDTFVPESILPSLAVGQQVSMTIDALDGKTFSGRIAEMEPSADPVSHSARVKIDMEDRGKLIPGMYGKARFITGERSTIRIPEKAVVKRGQITAVFIIDPERILHLRLIRTGESRSGWTEVLSGLRDGDRIALSELDRIEDGMEVAE